MIPDETYIRLSDVGKRRARIVRAIEYVIFTVITLACGYISAWVTWWLIRIVEGTT